MGLGPPFARGREPIFLDYCRRRRRWRIEPGVRKSTTSPSPTAPPRDRGRNFMKALGKNKAGPGLWLADVPRPEIGINDVLIQVDRIGICGTVVHIYKWDE